MSTNTYTSTNARRCASCNQPKGRCLASCPDNISRTAVVPVVPGDLHDGFTLADAYVLSQDVSAIQAEARALGYLRNDTLAGGLSWTGVMDAISNGPQSHGDGRTTGRGAPVWALVCVFLGLALIGLSLFINYVWLPGSGLIP